MATSIEEEVSLLKAIAPAVTADELTPSSMTMKNRSTAASPIPLPSFGTKRITLSVHVSSTETSCLRWPSLKAVDGNS